MYLGIDLGTSSLKASLANSKGEIICTYSSSYNVSYPFENYSEQNPNDWLKALIIVIKLIKDKVGLEQIKAVSFCGQMHGLVILDEFDNVLYPAILWNDNRTIEESNYLNEVIGKENLLKWTGNISFPGFTAPKLLWLKKHENGIFKKIKKIMLPKDYLVYKMSGVFSSDVSDNSGTLYFDVRNKTWSKEVLNVLDISINQLPKIFESYEVVGNVSPIFAKESGLPLSCKVVAGGGDQAVGALGTGTVKDGQLSISLGTSGVVFASSKEFKEIYEEGIHSFAHANNEYMLMGVMLSAAGSLDWWIKNILQVNDFDKEIGDLNDDKEIYFLPYLAGERGPINDPNIAGQFYGLKINTTRSDLTASVIQGISLGLKDCYNAISKTGLKFNFGVVTSGGSKSKKWIQLLSNCLNLELRTLTTNEGGSLGAIILALVGGGVYKTVNDATNELIHYNESYYPQPKEVEKYNKKYTTFKNIYLRNKGN
jgi:xylulokinase